MAHWPLRTGPVMIQNIIWDGASQPNNWNVTTSALTMVTASSTVDTKGSWVELESSTSADRFRLYWRTGSQSGQDTSMLMDLGIGGVGSEQIIIPDICVGWAASPEASRSPWMDVPMSIPSGSRLAARTQAAISSDTVWTGIEASYGYPMEGKPSVGTRCTTYGATSASSSGTLVTPGTDAFGSWVEITSSTTYPIHWLGVSVQGDPSDLGTESEEAALEIGMGAGGSEERVFGHQFDCGSSEDLYGSTPAGIPITTNIPAGTRLAARIAHGSGSLFSICVHGYTR